MEKINLVSQNYNFPPHMSYDNKYRGSVVKCYHKHICVCGIESVNIILNRNSCSSLI